MSFSLGKHMVVERLKFVSAGVYCCPKLQDELIYTCLQAFVKQSVESVGLAQYFFFRSSYRGPHIRIWLQSTKDIHREEYKRVVKKAFDTFSREAHKGIQEIPNNFQYLFMRYPVGSVVWYAPNDNPFAILESTGLLRVITDLSFQCLKMPNTTRPGLLNRFFHLVANQISMCYYRLDIKLFVEEVFSTWLEYAELTEKQRQKLSLNAKHIPLDYFDHPLSGKSRTLVGLWLKIVNQYIIDPSYERVELVCKLVALLDLMCNQWGLNNQELFNMYTAYKSMKKQ